MTTRNLERWRRPERVFPSVDAVVATRGEHIVSVQAPGMPPLDALVDFVGSDITFVSFHAALSKETFTTPYFTGATLAARKANRILVSDPNLSSEVLLAWFAGSRAVGQQQLDEFVATLIERAGGRHTVFFGGSGGGFAALRTATNHPGSVAVVANPQTDILRFHPRWWTRYATHCWGSADDQQAASDVIRANVAHDMVALYGERHPDVDVLYMQNLQDEFHIEHHLRPFLEATGGARVELIQGDWGPGHARPPRERIVEVLDGVFTRRRGISVAPEPRH